MPDLLFERNKRIEETKERYKEIENKITISNLKHFYLYEFKLLIKKYEKLENIDYSINLFPKHTNLYKYYKELDVLSVEDKKIFHLHNVNLTYENTYINFDLQILNSISKLRNYQLNTTPYEVLEFIEFLFAINENNYELLDLFVGKSNLIPYISNDKKQGKYYGLDLNLDLVIALEIQLLMSNIYFQIEISDVLNNKSIINTKKEFKYIFANLPFRIKEVDFEHKISNALLPLNPKNSLNYFYIDIILRNISKDGKAVLLTSSSSLSSNIDLNVRKYLLDNGLLEAIYALPSNLYENTSINSYIYVLSKNNKVVKMANLKKYYKSVFRNRKTFTPKEAINNLNNEIVEVDLKDIKNNDYNLKPDLYLIKDLKLDNTIGLGEIADVFTGWQISKKGLEARYDENGDTSILQVADINNYQISKNAKYKIENEIKIKYKLQKGDIILTAKSPRVEIAVVKEDNLNIIPAATLTVLRVKEGYDPYYIASFLESKIGKELIKLYQSGNVIKNLTPSNVKKIPIPKKAYETQMKIGKEFKINMELLIQYKSKIIDIKEKITKNEHFN